MAAHAFVTLCSPISGGGVYVLWGHAYLPSTDLQSQF